MKLSKTYDASQYEAEIYKKWEQGGAFKASPTSDKPHFSIAMPPPNETGTLHVGHALFLTLQDVMARHARQQGKDVLWLPGTDHAALATNSIIEKQLAEQGTHKHAIGREEFLKRTQAFVANSRDIINSQIRAMGASCDWSRTRYTLDDALNRSVNETFVKMYKDGLIYRGHRIVNWDPASETTVSDDEVDYKEEKAPLYTLQYGPFQISTARPETKFGDKYVVIHPDDKRYAQYKDGESFECEWLNGKVTATIVKDEAVEPEFGTGVMTITPWHDRTDFEIAERHGLEREQIIDYRGRLLPIAGEFAGQSIEKARPKIVEKLRAKDLLVSVDENYVHNIALNSRGKGVIEPQIMLQWFVDVNRPAMEWKGQQRSFKEVMRAVVEDGDIQIIPKRFEKTYYSWIDNLRDWCISRQIWWGHQIPVWYKKIGYSGQVTGDSKEEIYVGVKAPEGRGWKQDPDTLDTWFSSALWTWSTLIDPELAKDFSLSLDEILDKSIDYKTYHPTSVMETGWDILFFWVARMVLATTYMTGEVPFKKVYLHGLVRTEGGKKMSKSDPDTIVDPMEVIPKYGTDALRLALVSGTGAGNDQRLGLAKIVANRNFCNKLWNIARYIQSVIDDVKGETSHKNESRVTPKSAADHWILRHLATAADDIAKALDSFEFATAYDRLYHFVWDDFADWYIEASKVAPNPVRGKNLENSAGSQDTSRASNGTNAPLLAYVLEQTLKLAHPFAPFLTETIWQSSQGQSSQESSQGQTLRDRGMLIAQPWPEVAKFDKAEADKFEETRADIMAKRAPDMAKKLVKEKAVLEQSIKLLRGRLANKAYIAKAPEKLIEESKTELKDNQEKLAQLQKILESLEL